MSYLLYFILIFLSVFQDLPLGNLIGLYGESICGLVAIVFLPFVFSLRYKSQSLVRTWTFSFYIFCFLLVNLLFTIAYSGSTIGGENVFIKSIKGLTYFFSISVYIFDVFILGDSLSKKHKIKPFVFTFYFLLFVQIIELKSPELLYMFHCNPSYNRIRLLTSESSQTSSIIMVFSLVTLYYYLKIKRSPFLFVFSLLVLLFFVICSSSKSLLIIIVLSCLLSFLGWRSRYKKIILLGMVTIMVFIFPNLYKLLSNDILNYTSFSTRLFTVMCSILIMFKYPLGTGTAAYVPILQQTMKNMLPWFSSTFSFLRLSEIESIALSTSDKNVTIKSGIFQFGIQVGFLGLFFLVHFFFLLYKKVRKGKDFALTILFWSLVISTLFIGYEIKYDFYCGIVALCFLAKIQRASHRVLIDGRVLNNLGNKREPEQRRAGICSK
jgi:hypothetical protein